MNGQTIDISLNILIDHVYHLLCILVLLVATAKLSVVKVGTFTHPVCLPCLCQLLALLLK
jgi:hypothetical protein